MPQNLVLSRLLPAALAVATLAPAAPTAASAGRGGGRGLGGGGGFGPTMKPSALCTFPAETTAAKVKDPELGDRAVNQETFLRHEFGVRTFGYTSFVVNPPNGQIPPITLAAAARRKVYSGAAVEGRHPVHEFAGGKE